MRRHEMHISDWLNEGRDRGARFDFSAFLGILALLVGTSATASSLMPEETLRAYYRAINDGNEYPKDLDKGVSLAESPSPAPEVPSSTDGAQVPKLLHGSEYLLRHCWNQDELRASQGEDEIRWEDGSRDALPDLPADSQDWIMLDRGVTRGSQIIRSVHLNSGSAAVALTFNLIERAKERSGYDGALVDILRQLQVPATFFASGKWMLSHPKRARQLMADPLFEVGLLGWDHRNLALLGGADVRQRLLWGEAAYKKVRDGLKGNSCITRSKGAEEMSLIAPAPTLFRFPYGRCETAALDTVAAFGAKVIQWSLVSDDIARNSSVASIQERVESLTASNGAGTILVGHGDGRGDHTAAAMEDSIPRLRKQGYKFVTVSQLLSQGRSVTAMTCYEHEPNDNLSYDRRFSD